MLHQSGSSQRKQHQHQINELVPAVAGGKEPRAMFLGLEHSGLLAGVTSGNSTRIMELGRGREIYEEIVYSCHG